MAYTTEIATQALLIDGEDVALRARRAARELEAGTVWINEHLAFGSEMPHGGVKDQGSART
jgi:acyl-CoA reductase-like NAD-dependent aldehyde dehydrogenase